jgi:hypothetical protein
MLIIEIIKEYNFCTQKGTEQGFLQQKTNYCLFFNN